MARFLFPANLSFVAVSYRPNNLDGRTIISTVAFVAVRVWTGLFVYAQSLPFSKPTTFAGRDDFMHLLGGMFFRKFFF